MPIDPPAGLDRRALLRRMAVGGAVVRAAPAMHSVASAQAAPSCTPGVLDWDTFGTAFTNAVVGGVTVSMAITGVTNTTLLPNNGRVLAGPAGGVNQRHLRFEHTPDNATSAKRVETDGDLHVQRSGDERDVQLLRHRQPERRVG